MTRSRRREIAPSYVGMERRVNGVPTHTLDTSIFDQLETMTDEVSPNFKKRRNLGEIINNPARYVKHTFKSTAGGVFDVTQSGTRYEADGGGSLTTFMTYLLAGYPQYLHGIPPMPEPSFSLVDAAEAQALGNLDRSPYSFAEDIAEMRETLKFLRSPLASIKSLADEFGHTVNLLSKAQRFKNRIEAIANVWLTYQFAFSPLVRSANDLFEAYGDKVHRPKRRTARGKAEFLDTVSEASGNPYYFWSSSATAEIEQKAGILYEVTNPVNNWRYKYGLRFKDIPETLWAVMPYSFMVDRMFNFSQAARGLVSFLDPNVNILAGWTTEKSTHTGVLSYTDYQHPAASAVSIQPDVDITTDFVYDRRVWVPAISDLVPVPKLGGLTDSISKVADLAALILQRIR